MKIQFVTNWIQRHSWGPIPDEWFVLEGLTQAGLGRIVNLENPPQHKILPLRFGSHGEHEIYLENDLKAGYDLSVFFISSARNWQLERVAGPKIGITFDLPSFLPLRQESFLRASRYLDLMFETCDEKLHCKTHLVNQGVRLGAPFINTSTRNLPVAFFGRTKDRPERRFLQTLVEKFGGAVFNTQNGIHNEKLWEVLSKTKLVLGAYFKANYWSNRVYLMTETGGCFLCPYTPGLEREFENKKHIVWAYSDSELEDLISYYLRNPQEASEIRYEVWKHNQKEHTYFCRGKQMINILKKEGLL